MYSSRDFLEEANAVKVIAFMETEPLSDNFQQIALSKEQSRKLRDAIFAIITGKDAEKEDAQDFTVVTNDKFSLTIPNVPGFYEKAFFEEDK